MLLKILTFSLSCYIFETKFSLDLKDLLLFSGVFDTLLLFLKIFCYFFQKSTWQSWLISPNLFPHFEIENRFLLLFTFLSLFLASFGTKFIVDSRKWPPFWLRSDHSIRERSNEDTTNVEKFEKLIFWNLKTIHEFLILSRKCHHIYIVVCKSISITQRRVKLILGSWALH
jgi:hypothetical protein